MPIFMIGTAAFRFQPARLMLNQLPEWRPRIRRTSCSAAPC